MADSRQPLNPDALRLEPAQGGLASYPAVEKWDDWVEYDAAAWPRKVEKHYRLIPTICFNCEAACGLLAYVDKETHRDPEVRGQPGASRAAAAATAPRARRRSTRSTIRSASSIRCKRVGTRGEGKWERVSGTKCSTTSPGASARRSSRKTAATKSCTTSAGPATSCLPWSASSGLGHRRPQQPHQRLLGGRARRLRVLDGHRPAVARPRQRALHPAAVLAPGDRPLLQPARPADHRGKMRGAKICVIDPRLSNTASMADYWLSPWPGRRPRCCWRWRTCSCSEDRYDREFVRRWVNWEEYLREERPDLPADLRELRARARRALRRSTRRSSPRREAASTPRRIVEVAREIGRRRLGACHPRLAQHRGGQPRRLAGGARAAVPRRPGRRGRHAGRHRAQRLRTSSSRRRRMMPPPAKVWNELLMPREYPLAFFEMSFLLPHFLKEGRGKLAMYFTRVYNPVWTNPDGMIVDRDADRREPRSSATPASRRRGARPRGSPTTSCRWATAPSATTS